MQLFMLLDIQKNQTDGNPFLNRYWFLNPSVNEQTSEDVANAFVNTWMNVARSIQSDEIRHDTIYVKEVVAGIDEFLGTITGALGVRPGDSQPDYVQYSFFAKPAGPQIRRGGKRMAGVSENDTNGNVASGTVTNFLPFFAALLTGGLELETAFLTHVIVRALDTEPNSWLTSPVLGGAYRQLSTQRSRLVSNGSSTPGFVALTPAALTATDLTGFVAVDYEGIVDDILAAKAAAPTVIEQTVVRSY